MGIIEIVILGVGLSMDAFAIAICKGLNMKKLSISQGLIIAFAFGFFQFLMPVIGYFFGSQFEGYIKNFDHWIVFVLLAFIGIKMIVEAIKEKEKNATKEVSKDSIKNKKIAGKKAQRLQKNEGKNIENLDTRIQERSSEKLNLRELFVLAIATSIDALASGIALACSSDENIFLSGGIIGFVTFGLSFVGVIVGNFFGEKFKKPAEILGGTILVLIGLKVLLEHLGIIAF